MNTTKELLLKSYIHRLTNGEDIEQVREDFKQNFSEVSAIEIARAEQTLMKEGTALADVQKLCDVHSALFHGATAKERIDAAEREVARSAREIDAGREQRLRQMMAGFDHKVAGQTDKMLEETGHPLQVLKLENQAIAALLDQIERERKEDAAAGNLAGRLQELTAIAKHYGKKDELMFPLLKDQYGYNGPADVMWGVEDEIREALRQALAVQRDQMAQQAEPVLKRIREMIYKEENILFPLCAENFSQEQWLMIAKDMPLFGPCLISEIPVWEKLQQKEAQEAEKAKEGTQANQGTQNDKDAEAGQGPEDGKDAEADPGTEVDIDAETDKSTEGGTGASKIHLPGGSFSPAQLRAMLNTLPMEITLIDEKDTNSFFNEGEKLFIRPTMAIGRPVYSCHPKRVEQMVRMVIQDFKTGRKDSLHLLADKSGRQVLIHYYALRDQDGTYLGTMEAVQEMDGIADALKKGARGPVTL